MMHSVMVKEEVVEGVLQNVPLGNTEGVLREKLHRTEERLRQMEDYNVDLRAQLASVKSEKVIKSENDSEMKQLYDQLKYKDGRILELNNVIMEKERRIIDLQELCREQNQVAKSKKMAVQIVNKRLQELDDRQMKDVGTEIDSAMFSSSRERSSRIGGGTFPEGTHKRNESPGRAISQIKGKNGSPPPIDPSEDFGLSGEDSWSENVGEGGFLANKFSEGDGKNIGAINGRKRVTFDFAPSNDTIRRSRNNRSSSAERVTRREFRSEFLAKNDLKGESSGTTEIQFLRTENDRLRNSIEEMQRNSVVTKSEQLSNVKSELKEIHDAAELEKCQQDGRAKVLKARAAAQSRIRELEENIAGLQLSSAKEIDNLTAINETLKASREWLLNENGNLLKKNEDLRCKVDDMLGELDATLATSALFRGRLEESEKRIEALGGELAEVRRSLHHASETKQILYSEVERLKEALFAQDEFISVLEGDLIVYEAHVGILRDSLGASKKKDRQTIKSKAFSAKLNALEMEKQAIVKRSNDERLRTKALSVKIRCLEQERNELLQRIRQYEQLHGSNRDQHIHSHHRHEHTPQNSSELQTEQSFTIENLCRASSLGSEERNEKNLRHTSLPPLMHPQPLVPSRNSLSNISGSDLISSTAEEFHQHQDEYPIQNITANCKSASLSTSSSPFAPILPSPQHVTDPVYNVELESNEICKKSSLVFVEEPTGTNGNVHDLPQKSTISPLKNERENALALSLQGIILETTKNLLSCQNRLKEVESELDILKQANFKLNEQLQAESGLRSSINQKIESILQIVDFEVVDGQDFDEVVKLERLFVCISELNKSISDLLEKRTNDEEKMAEMSVNLSAAIGTIDELKSANFNFLERTKELEAEKHELSQLCVTSQDQLSACEAKLLRAENLLSENSSNVQQFERELSAEREQCAALREAKERAEFRLNEVDKQLLEMMVDKENFEQKLSILQENNSYLTATLDREKGRLERLVDLLRREVDRFRVEAELSRTCLEDLRLNSASASVTQQHQQQQQNFYLHQQEQQIQLHEQQERDRAIFEQQQQQISNMNTTANPLLPPPLREQAPIPTIYMNNEFYGPRDRHNIATANTNLQLDNNTVGQRFGENCESAHHRENSSFNLDITYIGSNINHGEVEARQLMGSQDLSNIVDISSSNITPDGNVPNVNLAETAVLPILVDNSNLQQTPNKSSSISQIKNINENASLVTHSQQGDNFIAYCEKKPELVSTAMPEENIVSSDTKETPTAFELSDHSITNPSQAMDLEVFMTKGENVVNTEDNSALPNDKFSSAEISELSKTFSEMDHSKGDISKEELTEEKFEVLSTDDFVSNVMEDINRLLELKSELETSVDVLKAEIWSLNGQLRKQLCEHEEVAIRLKTCEELLAASNKKLLIQNENILELRDELTTKSTEFDKILQEKLKIEAEFIDLDGKCEQLQEQLIGHHTTFEELTESTRLVALLESENDSLKSDLSNEKYLVGQLQLELDHKSEQLIQLQLEKIKIGEESESLIEQLNELQESYDALVAKTNVKRSDQCTETTSELLQAEEPGKNLDSNAQPQDNTTSLTVTSAISSKTVSLPLLNPSATAGLASEKLQRKYRSVGTPASCSLVHPVNMQLAILAARFDAKCSDNDSLFRTNSELAHTNSRLLNTIEELEAKIRLLTQANTTIQCNLSASGEQIEMEPIVESEEADLKLQQTLGDTQKYTITTENDAEKALLTKVECEEEENDFNELIEECFDKSLGKSDGGECCSQEDVISQQNNSNTNENSNVLTESNVEITFIRAGLQDLTIAEAYIEVKHKKIIFSESASSTVPTLVKKKKVKSKGSHSSSTKISDPQQKDHIQEKLIEEETKSPNPSAIVVLEEDAQYDNVYPADKTSDKLHFGPFAATRLFDAAIGSAAKVGAVVASAASEAAAAVSEIAIAQNVSTSTNTSSKFGSLLDGLKSVRTEESPSVNMQCSKVDADTPKYSPSNVGINCKEEPHAILKEDTLNKNPNMEDDNNWDWNDTNWADDSNEQLDCESEEIDANIGWNNNNLVPSNASSRITVVHNDNNDSEAEENGDASVENEKMTDCIYESVINGTGNITTYEESGNENEAENADESWDW